MRCAPLALLFGGILTLASVPCSATPSSPPLFTQCPTVGSAAGCTYLIDFGPNGAITLLPDPNVKDVDTKDDILIGILNNSGTYLSLWGYTGPNNVFSSLHLTGGLWDGKSTYFEMKDPFEDDNDRGGEDDDQKNVTPEPGSILLLGTGLVVSAGLVRRQLEKNCQS